MEENKTKFYPTEDDLNPNLKFINNRVILGLEDNLDFQKKEELFKVNWVDESEIVRKFYGNLRKSEFYAKYMNNGNDSFEDDKLLFLKILKIRNVYLLSRCYGNIY